MQKLILILMTFSLISCATNSTKENLRKKLNNESSSTLEEMRESSLRIIARHPELKSEDREVVKKTFNAFIDTHQQLKDDESKMIKLLTKKSLNYDKLTKNELKEKSLLKKKLKNVYNDKYNNVMNFVKSVTELSEKSKINQQMQNEMILFMFDFR